MTDDHKVFVTVGDVTYRGRHSVRQSGGRVIIDGKVVGVEVDNDGNPLAMPLPAASVVTSQPARLRPSLRFLAWTALVLAACLAVWWLEPWFGPGPVRLP